MRDARNGSAGAKETRDLSQPQHKEDENIYHESLMGQVFYLSLSTCHFPPSIVSISCVGLIKLPDS